VKVGDKYAYATHGNRVMVITEIDDQNVAKLEEIDNRFYIYLDEDLFRRWVSEGTLWKVEK
jgi:hypothetical protein